MLVLFFMWTEQNGAEERVCSRLGLKVGNGLGVIKTVGQKDLE